MLDNECFIRLNKDLIKRNEFDDKMILVVSYIGLYRNARGYLDINIDSLASKFGYQPDSHKGRINNKIRDKLNWLETNNYIFIHGDMDKIKNNESFTIEINGDNNIYDPASKFVIIDFDEYNTIMKSDTGSYKGRLLNVYTHIKKRIKMDECDGKRRYPISINRIANDCGITRGTNIRYILDTLIEMSLIYIYECGSYEDNNDDDNVKNVVTYYAVEDEQFDGVKEEALEYLKSNGVEIEHFNKKAVRKTKSKNEKKQQPASQKLQVDETKKDDISDIKHQTDFENAIDDVVNHISGRKFPTTWGEPPPEYTGYTMQSNEPSQEEVFVNDLNSFYDNNEINIEDLY